MIESEIKTFGIRDVRDMGMSGLLKYTDENGIAVVSTYGRPRCMVMPLTLLGIKKAINQISALFNEMDEDDEMVLSMRNLLSSVQTVMGDLEKQ